GLLDRAMADRLKRAGLDRLNHNLNTSRRHYPAVCTTHTYDDRLATLHAARTAGLSVCSGLIVGMGETHEDLLDVAYELRDIQAESIPVNFLVPITGNRLTEAICDGQALTPQFVLRVLCMMRLINPNAEIRIAAGREVHLRSMQALALWPANSLFVDGYLLTAGSAAAATLKMIFDAGFVPRLDDGTSLAEVRRLAESASSGPGLAAPADQSLPETAPLKLSVQAAPQPSAPSQETGV
ncbi:MAG: radical SAM protein, partial [Phycisphaeraceae bacterium]|nr:radical SAM protein [Phycisphaeraceae bacterium]